MQVEVIAQTQAFDRDNLDTTNTFQFTFKADKEAPVVLPKSYADGAIFLNIYENNR